jgi:CO/xanthine dehydrogenase Mo-binding subunit
LLEDTIMADGAMINGNMTNYVVPTSADVPPIQVMFHEQPYSYGPYGAKGIGELPMDGPAPAVVNAVSDAIGVQIDALPCSPERLMEAIIRKNAEEEAST